MKLTCETNTDTINKTITETSQREKERVMVNLTIGEVLREFNISRATLYRMIDEGLPYMEMGTRKRVFDGAVVADFIERRKNSIMSQLVIGNEYTNEEISEMFKCNKQRGMKKSNTANALILMAKHEPDNSYDDYWDKDGVFYYSGMGVKGNQELDFYENKTLNESNKNGVTVHLFEKFVKHEFIYRGVVRLVGKPFQKDELDYYGNLRKVWKFPLKLVNSERYISEEVITEQQKIKEKAAKRASKEELIQKAEEASLYGNVTVRNTVTQSYERNEFVKEYSLLRAKGVCELCRQKGPFVVDGMPFLESHHIVWLSRGGADSIDNISAVCPNCHRKLHRLDLPEDVETLRKNMEEDDKTWK